MSAMNKTLKNIYFPGVQIHNNCGIHWLTYNHRYVIKHHETNSSAASREKRQRFIPSFICKLCSRQQLQVSRK